MRSAISWLAMPGYKPETWEIVEGCTKVSAGCRLCWAEAMHSRLRTGHPFSDVRTRPDRLDEPLRWRKPRMVFVCSRSDLFHEAVADLFILESWLTMAMMAEHIFIILTKRPERMRSLLSSNFIPGSPHGVFGMDIWPLPNVWLGVSVEDQATADERIPLLLYTPAKLHYASYEPALGPVNLSRIVLPDDGFLHKFPPEIDALKGTHVDGLGFERNLAAKHRLHWVICGAESGSRRRAFDIDWARSIRDQCVSTGVPFFFKQGSHRYPERNRELDGVSWSQWPKVPDAR